MWDDQLGAGLQIALFDAAAKAADCPLWQLLGQQVRDRCHISWWDIDLSAEDWISECRLAAENGYTAYKTKGRPWWSLIDNLRELCATLPEHFEVDMDFNGFGIDTAHSTRLLKELEQFHHVVMFESPIPHHDVAGYTFLRQHTHVPISMHTQNHPGEPSLETAIREEMVDGFVVTGGATKIQQDALVCREFNKSFFLQVVGTKIAGAFGLHLGAVLEHARWPSVNCFQLFERDCVSTPLEVSNGLCTVPDGPGLGIELDEEAIELFGCEPKEKPYPHPDLVIECNLHDSDNRLLDRVHQVVPREAFRANFLYVLHDALAPGEYSLVVRCGGQEVARRRIVLEPAADAVQPAPVAN